ncbi:MAG: CoA-binding protein [Gammaproteobacteria bacterium]
MRDNIDRFLASAAFGVIGVSKNRQKYGNKVLRAYLQKNKTVYPIHPTEKSIEGLVCLHKVAELPDTVKSLSIITPPPSTEKIVSEAIAKGITNIWMQPGAESEAAIKQCEEHGINVIARGPCILVEFNFREDDLY